MSRNIRKYKNIDNDFVQNIDIMTESPSECANKNSTREKFDGREMSVSSDPWKYLAVRNKDYTN